MQDSFKKIVRIAVFPPLEGTRDEGAQRQLLFVFCLGYMHCLLRSNLIIFTLPFVARQVHPRSSNRRKGIHLMPIKRTAGFETASMKLSVNYRGFATNYMTQSAHSKTLQVLRGFKLSVACSLLIIHSVPRDVSYFRKQMHRTFQTAKSESRTWKRRTRKIHVGCKKK